MLKIHQLVLELQNSGTGRDLRDHLVLSLYRSCSALLAWWIFHYNVWSLYWVERMLKPHTSRPIQSLGDRVVLEPWYKMIVKLIQVTLPGNNFNNISKNSIKSGRKQDNNVCCGSFKIFQELW